MKTLRTAVEKDNASANRLRALPHSDFNAKQLEKIANKNLTRREEIETLENRMKQLEQGSLDKELRQARVDARKQVEQKTQEIRQKLETKTQENSVKKQISRDFSKASYRADREVRYSAQNHKRSYAHFVKALNSLPSYMERNLSEMPANKGYFWKSVACYGKLPEITGQPTVLFDKRPGGLMIIHEWTQSHYTIYEKRGKEQKTLKSCIPRKNKAGTGIVIQGLPETPPTQPSPVSQPNQWRHTVSDKHPNPMASHSIRQTSKS
jgi:hypothetical protein